MKTRRNFLLAAIIAFGARMGFCSPDRAPLPGGWIRMREHLPELGRSVFLSFIRTDGSTGMAIGWRDPVPGALSGPFALLSFWPVKPADLSCLLDPPQHGRVDLKFAPAPPEPPPLAPWEVEPEDDEDEHEEGSGIFAVKEKSEPLPDFWDDEHPLADNYRCSLDFSLGEVWIDPYYAALGLHLLKREADEVIPEEPPNLPQS